MRRRTCAFQRLIGLLTAVALLFAAPGAEAQEAVRAISAVGVGAPIGAAGAVMTVASFNVPVLTFASRLTVAPILAAAPALTAVPVIAAADGIAPASPLGLAAVEAAASPAPDRNGEVALAGTPLAAFLEAPARGRAPDFARHLRSIRDWFAHLRTEDRPAQPPPLVAGGVRAADGGGRLLPAGRPRRVSTRRSIVPNWNSPGEKTGRRRLGLGAVALFFIGALCVAQAGFQIMGVAMPNLLENAFANSSLVTDMAIVSTVAAIFGRILAPAVINRFGLRKGLLGTVAVRVLGYCLLAGLLASHHISLPLFTALYGLTGLVGGAYDTAEGSVAPALFGQIVQKIENFNAWKTTLLQVVASIGPIVAGSILASTGVLSALFAFPAAFVLSLAMLALTLKLPGQSRPAPPPAAVGAAMTAPRASFSSALKNFWRQLSRGAKVVWSDPALKVGCLALTFYTMLSPFVCAVMAPIFVARLMGAVAPAVYGFMIGLYALGGLLGGVLMLAEQRRLKRLKDPAIVNEKLRRSMLRWTSWGALGLLAVAAMALPIPPLGALVALPHFLAWAGNLTLAAVALIPFGLVQTVVGTKLGSFFQARAPQDRQVEALGFLGAASLAVITLGLFGLKLLFHVAGFAPFIWIAAAMLPLGLYYVHLGRRLDRVTAPKDPPVMM